MECFKISRIPPETNCKNCGKGFQPKWKKNMFCSSSCSATYNNKKKGRMSETCEFCKKEFYKRHRDARFCSIKCSSENLRNNKIKKFLLGELSDEQVRTPSIRRYLVLRQEGKCEICGSEPFHNGRVLVFVVDHIDGDCTNNNHENIRAICPNCNSQTETFTGKNVGNQKEKRRARGKRKK